MDRPRASCAIFIAVTLSSRMNFKQDVEDDRTSEATIKTELVWTRGWDSLRPRGRIARGRS